MFEFSQLTQNCRAALFPSIKLNTLGGSLMLGLLTLPAQADVFNIPSGSLASGLNNLAEHSGLQLVYDSAITEGMQTRGLQGNYTPDVALRKLLTGSGLTSKVNQETVIIAKADGSDTDSGYKIAASQTIDTPEAESNNDATLNKIKVTASSLDKKTPAKSNEAEILDDSSPFNKSYTRKLATASTKTDIPIMKTPVSIQVVPRALMDDQQVISINDALKNVSGVQPGDYSYYDNAIIRGFVASQSTYRNGLRQAYITNLETANLDRIEVLKGPAAILFGRIEPGGLVNLASKRALDTPYYSLQQQFGSYSLYRTTLDATGPLLADKSLLYRMNIAYKDNNSYRDFVSADHLMVAPSLTWRPNDRFEANLDFEYQQDSWVEDGSDSGIPALGNRPANIPINRYLGDPQFNRDHPNTQDKVLVGLDWSYQLNKDWKIKNRFQYLNTDYHQHILWSEGLNDDNQTVNRGLWYQAFQRISYGTNLDLTGKFKTGFAQHDVLVGFDLYRYDTPQLGGFAFSNNDPTITPINIYNPQYGFDFNTLKNNAPPYDQGLGEVNNWYGIYFQDHITLWDKLHILGGGRHDWTEYGNDWNEPGKMQMERVDYFSPRVGILYQPWPWLSLYGNYVDSMGLNNSGRSRSGPLPPEYATQFEGGFKTELLDGRLTSTIAYFNIVKQNVAATDPENPIYSVAIGEVRSRGVEVDVTGKVSNNLNLIATYAYTDAEITKDLGTPIEGDLSVGVNPGNSGNRLASVPRHSGSLWAKYSFDSGLLQGLNIGSGVYLRSQREGDNANTFQMPGYVRWDASIGYTFKQGHFKITPQFNVYNILDKVYYDHSSARSNIRPGEPLTFLGAIRIEY